MIQPLPALLLTRPRGQSERFADDCRAVLGDAVRMVISPVLRIEPRAVALDLDGLAGIVLTSENGLSALKGRALPDGLVAYCVGDRTAAAAEAAGIAAISAGGAAGDLIEMITHARPEGPLLHLRGAESRGNLELELAAAGIELRSVVAYDQNPAELTDEARELLAGKETVVAPVFSPRSAAVFGAEVGDFPAPLQVVALSQAVAEAWGGPAPEAMYVADRPDAEAMLAALLTIYTGKLA